MLLTNIKRKLVSLIVRPQKENNEDVLNLMEMYGATKIFANKNIKSYYNKKGHLCFQYKDGMIILCNSFMDLLDDPIKGKYLRDKIEEDIVLKGNHIPYDSKFCFHGVLVGYDNEKMFKHFGGKYNLKLRPMNTLQSVCSKDHTKSICVSKGTSVIAGYNNISYVYILPKDFTMSLVYNAYQDHNVLSIDRNYQSNIQIEYNIYNLDKPCMIRYLDLGGKYLLLPIHETEGMIGFVNKNIVNMVDLNDVMIHNYVFDGQYSDIIVC